MKCTLTKSPGKPARKLTKGDPAPTAFNLQDNGNGTFTVVGTDAAGAQVDISSVATIVVSGDTPAVVTVDNPVGVTFGVRAATPAPVVGATAKVTVVATWNDGSVGPFTITITETIIAGPVTGIAVQAGPVTVH